MRAGNTAFLSLHFRSPENGGSRRGVDAASSTVYACSQRETSILWNTWDDNTPLQAREAGNRAEHLSSRPTLRTPSSFTVFLHSSPMAGTISPPPPCR
jgi:hypothetical protein